MSEGESRSATEEADEYIKDIKEAIRDYSVHEKNSILLEKLRYWYWSSTDWRNTCERENAKSLKILKEVSKKDGRKSRVEEMSKNEIEIDGEKYVKCYCSDIFGRCICGLFDIS